MARKKVFYNVWLEFEVIDSDDNTIDSGLLPFKLYSGRKKACLEFMIRCLNSFGRHKAVIEIRNFMNPRKKSYELE